MMKILSLLLCLFLCSCMTGSVGNVVPVEDTIRVLSINLCADWNSPRIDRAKRVVDFVRQERVGIILVQEGVKGVGQFDMVDFIAKELGYSYYQVPAFGVPGFLEFCVGIISAYPMNDVKGVGCQVDGGDPIDRVPFPGASRGIRATIAGFLVMSCHLTVPVEQKQKEEQLLCLQSKLPESIPAIWGGDFNMYRTNPAYSLINMTEAIYPGSMQVDMVFTRGFTVLSSKLVFEDHYISDHCGVLVELKR